MVWEVVSPSVGLSPSVSSILSHWQGGNKKTADFTCGSCNSGGSGTHVKTRGKIKCKFRNGKAALCGRSWQHIRRARQGTGLPAKSNPTKCPVGWSTLCKVGRVWEWNSSGTLPTRASQHLHSEQGICALATESRGRVAASKSIGLARMEEKPRVHPRKSWGTPDKYSPWAAAILPAVMRRHLALFHLPG